MEVLTNRNADIKIHEGYQYIFDKLGADEVTEFYRCRRRDIQCRGRIDIRIGVIQVTGDHGGHDESPVLVVEIALTITNIKRRALETMEASALAINQCIDYRNDADFNLHARMLTALAFVLPEDVAAYFETLSMEIEAVFPSLQPILDWLETYYIGMLRRQGFRRIPAFPIPTWNLYNRVLAEQMKTNNIAEASHRRLQAQLSMSNPTIWKFIIELRKVQAERDIYY